MSHLAVSNSTPPPSTSPIAIKVKSEPVSPPRDHHLAHTQSSASLSITTMNNATSNSSVLNHPQQHLIMSSRPNSTGGHLTPTPGNDHHHHHHLYLIILSSLLRFQIPSAMSNCTLVYLFILTHYLFYFFFSFKLSRCCAPYFSKNQKKTKQIGSVTPTNVSSPSDLHRHSNSAHIQDYDSPNQSHKRPRISEGWSTSDQL